MFDASVVLLFFAGVAFFLFHRLSRDMSDREEVIKQQRLVGRDLGAVPISFLDRMNKVALFVVGVVYLIASLNAVTLGEPVRTVLVNGTVLNFSSNSTIVSGPSAGNTTMQVIPVVPSYVRTETVSYTAAQNVFFGRVFIISFVVFVFFGLGFLLKAFARYVELFWVIISRVMGGGKRGPGP